VFGRALALDPENLIALRSLGDMSLQAGNTSEARTWYMRLLDADPKDAAVLALVSEIDASSEGTAPPPLEEAPRAEAVSAEQERAQAPIVEVSAPTAEVESAAHPPEPAPTVAEEPLGLERHYPTETEQEVSVEQAGSAEQLASETGEAIAGITSAREDDAGALSWGPASEEAVAEASTSEPEAAVVEDESEVAPEQEPEPAAAEYHAPPTPEPERAPSPERAKPATAKPEPVGAAADDRGFSGASAEPFVNETMAQLYLQQGYRQLALKVYRQLSASRPHDQALRDRIHEIEAADAAEHPDEVPAMRREEPSIERPSEPSAPRSPSIEAPSPRSQPGSEETPGFDRSPVDSPPAAPPSRERESIESPTREEPRAEPEGYGARQPSVREFFATLGRRRPPRTAGSPPMRAGNNRPAEPVPPPPVLATPAPSASLDAVFAGATVSPADARAASRLAGAFSGAAGSGTRSPATPAVPTPRVNPRMPPTQESEEDVAKFRAWLDGLTRE
jgi:tetratricopeptide (TPR) repeat protein